MIVLPLIRTVLPSFQFLFLCCLYHGVLLYRLEEDGVISECDINELALQEPTSDFQFKKAPLAGKIVVKVGETEHRLVTFQHVISIYNTSKEIM